MLQEAVRTAPRDDGGTVVYTCAMHREVRSLERGRCPICRMGLIPESHLSPLDGGESE